MHPPSSNSRNDASGSGAIQRVARHYQDEGYDVIIRPQGDELPTFAAPFQLDIIAIKGEERAIVQVKRHLQDLSSDLPITRVAEVTDAQPGWRLDVVVLDPETPFEKAAREAHEPSDEQLAEILRSTDEMIEKGHVELAAVTAWAGFEAVMRRVARDEGLDGPTEPDGLLRTLYSNGHLTREQFDRLKESYKFRTQVVHGLVPPKLDPELVRFVTATAGELAINDRVVVPSEFVKESDRISNIQNSMDVMPCLEWACIHLLFLNLLF